MELSQIFFPAVDHHLLMRRRFVAELAVVTGDSELLNQTELAEQFRLAENDFGKNLLVKQVQAPRPEPDQIDQKDREDDYRQENDGKEPLQNSFKHGMGMEPVNSRLVKLKKDSRYRQRQM